MQQYAFYPQTLTVACTPSAANQIVPLAGPAGTTNGLQVHVVNLSTQAIFLAFGGAAIAAVAVPGTNANGIPVPAGAVETFTVSAGTAAVGVIQATAGTGNAYFVQGEGL
jgi:hypothetical protein